MERLFSTHDVHQRDRFSYWHDVACKNLVEHECQPQSSRSFHAEIESAMLADIGLVLFENSPMTVVRTLRHVAHAKTDDLFLCRQVAGGLALEQEGREVDLAPGDMTLLDPMLPYQGRFSPGSRLLVLKIRRRELEARLGKTFDVVARSLKPIGAESGLTSAFLATLPAHAGRLSPVAEEIVRDQTLDLIAVSLAKAIREQHPRLSSPKMLTVLNVRAAIDARLTDPALDATTVAAAAGISVRYANAVLAQQETSVARLIRTKRLARCRRAFEDPLQQHRTVSEIAYGWGFSDMTHFGRAFKRAYGVLPSEYRRNRK